MRSNPKGVHFERWRHVHGCGRWFNVARDTVSDRILEVYAMGEPRPLIETPPRRPRAAPAAISRSSAPAPTRRHEPSAIALRQQHRLRGGGRIDRRRPLAFTFDGAGYEGYAGDTLASALLANGVHLVGRSFKYHRPRGIFGAGAEEPNALVQLGSGARTEPNARATQVELYEGLSAAARTAGHPSGSTCGRSTTSLARCSRRASTTRPSCGRRAGGGACTSG